MIVSREKDSVNKYIREGTIKKNTKEELNRQKYMCVCFSVTNYKEGNLEIKRESLVSHKQMNIKGGSNQRDGPTCIIK